MQEMRVQNLIWEDSHGTPLQYSYWENPMVEEPGRLRPMWSQIVRHNWSDWACTHLRVICLSPVDLVSLENCDWCSIKITLIQVRRTCAPWKQWVCLEHLHVSTMRCSTNTSWIADWKNVIRTIRIVQNVIIPRRKVIEILKWSFNINFYSHFPLPNPEFSKYNMMLGPNQRQPIPL